MLETARKSLRHSCRSELTRQGITLPLDRYSYSLRLLMFISIAFDTIEGSLVSTGQASDPILHLSILQSLVFLINSRFLLSCYTWHGWSVQVMLVPKLRMQFAEFLQHNFLNALVCSTQPPVSVLVRSKSHELFLVTFLNPHLPWWGRER